MERYGVEWPTTDAFIIEAEMFRSGGYMLTDSGEKIGHGRSYHFKQCMHLLWPHFEWHKWSELLIQTFVDYSEVGVMGPASSGKTYDASAFGLCYFYIFPKNTSVLMSTTTTQGLQLRIWGAIKELHNKAKRDRPFLPGRVIESMKMLVNDDGKEFEDEEGTDFRDGIIGIACKVGGTFVGLSNYVGLKNDRVILIADEASLMTRGFLDSVSNLRKNPTFKLIAMGNPKDRADALGVICEPHPSLGGWDGVGHEEKTRTWKTRAPGGHAIQLCGTDGPNAGLSTPIYRGIITDAMIEADAAYYGRDSLQFSMMNLGVMPKDGGSRRVITTGLCEQKRAFDDVLWASKDKLTVVAGLDAAYSGTGGDRCVLTQMTFGPDINGDILLAFNGQHIVPVDPRSSETPEEQIARWVMAFCESNDIPAENLGFDSTGRGSLGTAFARIWSAAVEPVEFGGRPSMERRVSVADGRSEADAYGKKVSALWFASRNVVECQQLRRVPRDAVEEAQWREWVINRNGSVDVEPKEKMKERMGRSPDLWDSAVVAIEMARKRGFHISSTSGAGSKPRTTPNWLLNLKKRHATVRTSHQLEYSA